VLQPPDANKRADGRLTTCEEGRRPTLPRLGRRPVTLSSF
jgi:hypothetical protein